MSVITSAAGTTTAAASRLAVLLFTDIVGSTELKSRLGAAAYSRLLSRHDELFKQSLAGIPSVEVINDTGDGYLVAFATASDAVRFALRMQRAMHDEPWQPQPLRVSIGVHLGEISDVADASGRPRVIGLAIDLAGRLTALATAGQILLTRTAFDEARQYIREYPAPAPAATAATAPAQSAADIPLRWIAHGGYRFKGPDEPVEVFEVGGEGIAPLAPPPDSAKARRSVSIEQEETLGWRPAVGLEVPQRVGWVLEQRLGEGTFGEVWLARDETTRRRSVFKFCFDLERLHSFKREVTFFRLLREALGERRDIAQLYEVRLDQPPYFLESEYAPGGNLLAWAATQGGLEKVPLTTRLNMVAEVCDAVAAAHSVGILHKDIKPGNILVHAEGDGTFQPQLADFGIGLLVDRNQLVARQITEIGFTGLGHNESSRTGTRMYAPPESLKGAPFTTQGDIYALGVLLYQMTVADLERPLASGWERDVSDELLRDDIARSVDYEPARRFGSAIELSRRLRTLPERAVERERERRVAEGIVRRKRLLRAGALALAACVLIAVVSVAGYFRERSLHDAVAGSATFARDRERAAQLNLLDSLLVTGDSLTQSKRYSEAINVYEQAWTLSDSLKVASLPAVSGLLQVRGEGPQPLINRRVTSRLDDKASPFVRVRVSPTGKLAVAGDSSGFAHIIDLPTGRRSASLEMKGWASGVAFARNGEVMLTGSSTGQLQVWDVGHWDKPRATATDSSFIYALATAPDGQTIASVEPSRPGRAGGKIYFWSLDPLRVTKIVPHARGLISAAFAPDGKTLAAGDEKGDIILVDVASATPKTTLTGHTAEVCGVALTPDGKRLLSGSFDKTVRLWDVASAKEVFRFSSHRGTVRDVSVARDGRTGASASSDQTIKSWDLENGRELLTFSRHPQGASSVDFLPDSSGIVTSGDNGRVAIWSLVTDDVPAWNVHAGRAAAIRISTDGLTAISAGWDGAVVQSDLATGQVLRRAKAPRAAWAIDLSRQGRLALVGGAGGVMQVLNLDDFSLTPLPAPDLRSIAPLPPPTTAPSTLPATQRTTFTDTVSALAISPDGKAAFIGGADRMFAVIDWPAGSKTRFARQTNARVMAACFTPDGSRLLVAVERDLYLLDAQTGALLQQMPPSTKFIAAVAIAADGRTAASAGYDNTVRILDLDTRLIKQVLTGHLGWVRAVAFLGDGKTVVSAGEDNTVRLWEAESGKEIRTFTGHTAAVCSLAVSANGATILSGDMDGTIRKWDLSRPMKYRALEGDLGSLHIALDANADDAAGLAKLGNWYAFHGRDDWAIDCFDRASAAGGGSSGGGGDIAHLLLARCYWRLDRNADAAREFQRVRPDKDVSAAYLNLCINAAKR